MTVRLATILEDGRTSAAVVHDGLVLSLGRLRDLASVRSIAAAGGQGMRQVESYVGASSARSWRPLGDVRLGPAVPDPGAIYTVGVNYPAPGVPPGPRPERPLIYGKLPTSVAAHGATLSWDRSLSPHVDAEVELGVVIGQATHGSVEPEDAVRHVFGWTCIDDVSSRDAWLDGDQWLLGKSMAGFCPVGPWIVTRDDLDPSDLRLTATLNGQPIQDGRTSQLLFGVADVIAFLSRHTTLRPGDLIATGTPARLHTPPGPDRHLEPGDVVAAAIEGIGELVTRVA